MQKTNEKGKFFTERVSKRRIDVAIMTIHAHVRGVLYVLPTQRMKDLLNNSGEQFLAVTDAVVTENNGLTSETPFIALNKGHIVSVVPLGGEDKADPEIDEYGSY